MIQRRNKERKRGKGVLSDCQVQTMVKNMIRRDEHHRPVYDSSRYVGLEENSIEHCHNCDSSICDCGVVK